VGLSGAKVAGYQLHAEDVAAPFSGRQVMTRAHAE
jgi:hypothetical protein